MLTSVGSRKAQLLETAGRFSLLADRLEPSVRYVSVEGSVTRMVPGTEELLWEISRRYLPADEAKAYVRFARAELGEHVAIHLRPERWLQGFSVRCAVAGTERAPFG